MDLPALLHMLMSDYIDENCHCLVVLKYTVICSLHICVAIPVN